MISKVRLKRPDEMEAIKINKSNVADLLTPAVHGYTDVHVQYEPTGEIRKLELSKGRIEQLHMIGYEGDWLLHSPLGWRVIPREALAQDYEVVK